MSNYSETEKIQIYKRLSCNHKHKNKIIITSENIEPVDKLRSLFNSDDNHLKSNIAIPCCLECQNNIVNTIQEILSENYKHLDNSTNLFKVRSFPSPIFVEAIHDKS